MVGVLDASPEDLTSFLEVPFITLFSKFSIWVEGRTVSFSVRKYFTGGNSSILL